MSISFEALAMSGTNYQEFGMDIEEWERHDSEVPSHLYADEGEEEEGDDRGPRKRGSLVLETSCLSIGDGDDNHDGDHNDDDDDDDDDGIGGGNPELGLGRMQKCLRTRSIELVVMSVIIIMVVDDPKVGDRKERTRSSINAATIKIRA
ncbi:hypothetical protein CsSME_00002652 [Camellia sinensis var. sinensis]